MIFFTHYRIADGEIMGWGHHADPQPIDANHDIAVHDGPIDPPDPAREKIVDGRLVDKTAEEQRASRRPTRRMIEEAIFLEMRRTGEFMVLDYPHEARTRVVRCRRPISDRGSSAAPSTGSGA